MLSPVFFFYRHWKRMSTFHFHVSAHKNWNCFKWKAFLIFHRGTIISGWYKTCNYFLHPKRETFTFPYFILFLVWCNKKVTLSSMSNQHPQQPCKVIFLCWRRDCQSNSALLGLVQLFHRLFGGQFMGILALRLRLGFVVCKLMLDCFLDPDLYGESSSTAV